jgi:hypothetical protein
MFTKLKENPSSLPNDHEEDSFQSIWEKVRLRISDSDALSQLEKIQDRKSLEIFIETVKNEGERHAELRKRSTAKRVGSTFQRLCVEISQFLDAYAGIADTMKGIDQRIGGLGYGSLSILVTVSMLPKKASFAY